MSPSRRIVVTAAALALAAACSSGGGGDQTARTAAAVVLGAPAAEDTEALHGCVADALADALGSDELATVAEAAEASDLDRPLRRRLLEIAATCGPLGQQGG